MSDSALIDQHTFRFDPKYENVHLYNKCELRFFCEAFSLMDSMRRKDAVFKFARKIRETNGVLECENILEILKEEGLIESTLTNEGGFPFLLDSIYQIIHNIVVDGFVSSSRTKSLGIIAKEVGQTYSEEAGEGKDSSFAWKEKGKLWDELAQRLFDLSEHQQHHLRIHHDFQKSNYAPDPRAKHLYGSTFLIIILGFLYVLLRNCRISEVREFMWMLSK